MCTGCLGLVLRAREWWLRAILALNLFNLFLAQNIACVCVTIGLKGNLKVWNRGRDGRFPSHANEAMEIDWMEVWTQTSVPVPLFRETGGNGTRHTCVSVPFLLFSSKATL